MGPLIEAYFYEFCCLYISRKHVVLIGIIKR